MNKLFIIFSLILCLLGISGYTLRGCNKVLSVGSIVVHYYANA